MKQKLRSRCGEMLVETLVAVLTIALASVVLASMIASASNLNRTAKAKDGELYSAISAIETKSGAETGTGKVMVNIGSGSVTRSVTLYHSGGSDPVYRYSPD